MPYSHELIETESKIGVGEDTTVHYSIFKRKEIDGADAIGDGDSKKTLVYIPGGPWSAFSTNGFLTRHKPFIADGFTVVVTHEPTRDGFGYN